MCAHQACYGIFPIPEGEWVCEKCQYLKKHPGEDVKCELCHIRKGAFKPTDEGKWCHACCCVWIPELGFRNPSKLDEVTEIDKVNKTRFRLTCQLCNERGGACIQCIYGVCRFAFHVSCAKEHGLRMEIRQIHGIQDPDIWDVAYLHYCPRHRDSEFDEKKYIAKKRRELEFDEKPKGRGRSRKVIKKKESKKKPGKKSTRGKKQTSRSRKKKIKERG